MRCSQCGNELGKVKFCPHCGAKNEAYQPAGQNQEGYNESLLSGRQRGMPEEPEPVENPFEDLGPEPGMKTPRDEEEPQEERVYGNYRRSDQQRSQRSQGEQQSHERDQRDHQERESDDYSHVCGSQMNTSDGLWNVILRLSDYTIPLARRIQAGGQSYLMGLIAIVALLTVGLGGLFSAAMMPRVGVFTLLMGLVLVGLSYLFYKVILQWQLNHHGIVVEPDFLRITILLTLGFNSIQTALLNSNNIIIAIIRVVFLCIFMLSIIREYVDITNYRSIGFRFWLFSFLFYIIVFAVIFVGLFALMAASGL